jgi:thiamine biosynthesis lipoprotein
MTHASEAPRPKLVRLALEAMATRFEFALIGTDEQLLRSAGEEALEEVRESDLRLSKYRTTSHIALLNRQGSHTPTELDAELFELLVLCDSTRVASGGAFDVTLGRGTLTLDAATRQVSLSSDEAQVDLGAIGKGFALDRAAAVLRESGVERALIHGGTSCVVALGAPPGRDAWGIEIADRDGTPRRVELCDRALATSAQHGRRDASGRGHVIDPRSGEAPEVARVAAVTAPSATLADAWSTACLVLDADVLPEPARSAGVQRVF